MSNGHRVVGWLCWRSSRRWPGAEAGWTQWSGSGANGHWYKIDETLLESDDEP